MNDLSSTELPSEPPDLTACEREPIHLPGAVEPNGAMLVLGEDALTILQASSNISKFLNLAPQDLLGMNLANLFSKEIVHQLVSGTKGDGERRYVVGLRARGGLLLDALVHRYKGLLIIEFEPANATLRDPDLALESRLKSSLLSQDVLILGRDPATVRQCERLPRAGRFSAGSRLSLCA
jgi:light-regulated signal transduction histidine kinase (bacteriophytochrome)